MDFDREELASTLADASPALAKSKSATIPGLDHYWFDGDYVYAYDGGLGVRLVCRTELDCGLPGRVLLELLRTSALKLVSIADPEKKDVVLQLGKSRVKLASLDPDRSAWRFPSSGNKAKAQGTLTLTEEVLAAISRVSFVRAAPSKETTPRAVDNGVTVVPQKNALEFYATDAGSIARTVVGGNPPKALPRFIAPWAFVDRFLQLAAPGAALHVLEDCLMVESKGVQICSNLLELPPEPDLPVLMARHLRDEDDPVVELPSGLQAVLDRATILAGQEQALVTVSTEGKALILRGRYGLGSLDEELPLKVKVPPASAKFRAHMIRRGLGQAKTFMLSPQAIVLDDGADFVYVHSAWYEPGARRVAGAKASGNGKARRSRADDDDDRAPPKRRPLRGGDVVPEESLPWEE